jgi:hypothetical protein
MNRASLTVLAALAVTATLAAPARAQDVPDDHGPLIGAGLGLSETSEPSADRSRFTPSVELRAGWAFSRSAALVVSAALNGEGGKTPESYFGSNDPAAVSAPLRSELVGTFSVLASLEVATPAGVYVRPGVGVAEHTFGAWYTFPTTTGNGLYYQGHIAHEWGPAAGLAVGRDLSAISPFPVKVEAVALWSGGEDSTGSRWSAGVQVVHDIRF